MTSGVALLDKLSELERRAQRGMLLGLDRVLSALTALGSPHEELAAVHIGGSNGKGSTAAMVEAIARAAGLRTGLYTSPHLCRFAERIRIDGQPIGDEAFDRALDAVLTRCRDDLTFFESLTLAAFVAFREARVDLAVLEVGLGGRLDATNVVAAPIATAITSIALEHTAILGDTLAAIAREKAGILKAGAPVVLGPVDPEADQAIAEVAASIGVGPLERVARASAEAVRRGAERGAILVSEEGDETAIALPGAARPLRAKLRLEGAHQAENAAVAAGIAHHVAARFPAVAPAIEAGLARAEWPGRFEQIKRGDVTVVLDAAHNPHGAAALAALLRRARLDPARTALVFGVLVDKRWPAMLEELAPMASRRYYTEPKGRPPAALDDLRRLAPGEALPEPRDALARAIAESRPGDTIVVTGSIYLVGEVRAVLLGIDADPMVAL
jgi:dihydrofolate synthase/folylpolyglutamate synthase